MYDPSIGRWLNQDPIGFEAGDSNLYRYVGNSPTNATDPSGMQVAPDPFTRGTNPQRSLALDTINTIVINTLSPICGLFITPSDRNSTLGNFPRLEPADLPRPPAGSNIRSTAGGGFSLYGVVPANTLIGNSGAGPCVGVILIPPNPNKVTYAIHLSARDNAQQTFSNLLRGVDLSGYQAVLNGAFITNDPEIREQVFRTLIWAVFEIQSRRISIRGYVPGPNAHVDRNGTIYWTAPPSESGAGY